MNKVLANVRKVREINCWRMNDNYKNENNDIYDKMDNNDHNKIRNKKDEFIDNLNDVSNQCDEKMK